MEIEQLDNESHAPIACEYCPNLRPHRSTHCIATRHPDYSRRVDYLCAQAAARALGLPLWKHLPIDALTNDELTDPEPRRAADEEQLALQLLREADASRIAPRPRRAATEHQLTEAELGLVREPSQLGEVTRRATPVERLAASLHGLVTGHADPTPAELAILIRRAIEDAAAMPTTGAVSE